jgi:DNA-binding transcriptional LysR family regulator
MEIRQLQQFVTLAETLSFRAAAERLHISQPPLSVSIRKLEQEIGAPLFERTTHAVNLTKAGESVLELARHILFNAAELPKLARLTNFGLEGELKIGFVGSAKYSLLQRILIPFKQRYPGVSFRFHEDSNHGILRALEKNDINIGIIRTPLSVPSHLSYEIAEYHEFLVALPTAHPLAARDTLSLDDLRHEPIINYTASAVPGLHALVSRLFEDAGITPNLTQEAVQVETVVFLVSIGMGIALVPSCVAAQPIAGVAFRKLPQNASATRLGLGLAFNTKYKTLIANHFLTMAVDS